MSNNYDTIKNSRITVVSSPGTSRRCELGQLKSCKISAWRAWQPLHSGGGQFAGEPTGTGELTGFAKGKQIVTGLLVVEPTARKLIRALRRPRVQPLQVEIHADGFTWVLRRVAVSKDTAVDAEKAEALDIAPRDVVFHFVASSYDTTKKDNTNVQ